MAATSHSPPPASAMPIPQPKPARTHKTNVIQNQLFVFQLFFIKTPIGGTIMAASIIMMSIPSDEDGLLDFSEKLLRRDVFSNSEIKCEEE